MKTVIGEYSEYGYDILTDDGRVLYSAGANVSDSSASGVDVPLSKIRQWCVKTGKEIASEMKAVWGGAEKVEAI